MANKTGFKTTKTFSDILSGTDFCDHVKEDDLSKAVGFFYERDSFGWVGTEICCQDCKDQGLEEEQATLVCCADCSGTFPRSQVIEWVPYDFYEPQGDVPTIVCHGCRLAEKHSRRVAKDQADHDHEFGHGDDSDIDVTNNEYWGSGAHYRDAEPVDSNDGDLQDDDDSQDEEEE